MVKSRAVSPQRTHLIFDPSTPNTRGLLWSFSPKFIFQRSQEIPAKFDIRLDLDLGGLLLTPFPLQPPGS